MRHELVALVGEGRAAEREVLAHLRLAVEHLAGGHQLVARVGEGADHGVVVVDVLGLHVPPHDGLPSGPQVVSRHRPMLAARRRRRSTGDDEGMIDHLWDPGRRLRQGGRVLRRRARHHRRQADPRAPRRDRVRHRVPELLDRHRGDPRRRPPGVPHRVHGAEPRGRAGAFRDAAVGLGPRCCTSRGCGPSTTPATSAPSCATPTATTSRPSTTPSSSVATRARRGRPRSASRAAARRPRPARARSRRGTCCAPPSITLRASRPLLERARQRERHRHPLRHRPQLGEASRDRLRKMPTDTGSTWIGPDRGRGAAMTASKTGRSNGGPVREVLLDRHRRRALVALPGARRTAAGTSGHTQLGTSRASLPTGSRSLRLDDRLPRSGRLRGGAARGRAGDRPRRGRRLPPRPGDDRAARACRWRWCGRRSTADVQATLRVAQRARRSRSCRGAPGTGLSGGSSAIDGAITLSTERMRAIDDRPAGDGRGRAARACSTPR